MYNSRITKSSIAALLLTIGLVGCGSDDVKTVSDFDAVDTTSPVDDWQLVWSDEFAGNRIDPNKWNIEVNCRGGGNQEQQCYTDNPENAFVSDGTLKIVALPADEDAELPYTSARLNSRHKGDFKYGRIEVRARMPRGQGSWPAAWMMPTDEVYGGWPKSGEIDIVEAVNLGTLTEEGEQETRVYGTLHYGRDAPNNSSSGKAYTLPNGANPADGFHTYAIEWQEGEIRWYVDGYLYQTQTQSLPRRNSRGELVGLRHRGWFAEFFNQATGDLEVVYGPQPFDQRFHLLLNLAVGGNWPENVNELGIDADAFANGQTFEIDYVRVYECASNPNTGRGCETIRAGYKDEETLVQGEAPIPSPPSDGVARNLTIFDGTPNPNWPAWDCCGGSTPDIVDDEEAGPAYRFTVGANPTVNGFISRSEFITDPSGSASPFDASPILETGSVKFDIKVLSQPNAETTWLFKIESNSGSTEVELPISASEEGLAPGTGEWQTVTYSLQSLADAGLDVSGIDVVMIFPAWGTGEGAVYRVDEARIYDPSAGASGLTIFADNVVAGWSLWDCCAGSEPQIVEVEEPYGRVAQFEIPGWPETVLGFLADEDVSFDASALIGNGAISFDMRIVQQPTDGETDWLFKVESTGAETAVELPLSAGNFGIEPATGEWARYHFSLQDLSAAGLDLSDINVIMVFPAWGSGQGTVYQIDNVKIDNF